MQIMFLLSVCSAVAHNRTFPEISVGSLGRLNDSKDYNIGNMLWKQTKNNQIDLRYVPFVETK